MSDDVPEDAPALPPVPVPPVKPSQFPEGHTFPQALLEKWVAIPAAEPVLIGPLTRGDLDYLLFGFGDMAAALAELRQGLIEYSNERYDVANAHLQNAINRNVDAETKHRMLFEAIMKSVIEVRENAGK